MDYESLRKAKLVVFKIVDASQLEIATSQGWVLIQVLTESQVMQGIRFETKAAYWDSTRNVNQPAEYHQEPSQAYSVHTYLLARDAESALALLDDQLKVVKGKLAAADATAKEIAKQIATDRDTIAMYKQNDAHCQRVIKERDDKIVQLTADVKTMKGDDQKLKDQLERCRRELGERQFKKIVEPEVADGGKA